VSNIVSAVGSSLHVLGFATVVFASIYRIMGLWRRDISATRLGDGVNGMGAVLLIGSGLWRLFGGLEKPLPFYTENPIFWAKMSFLGLSALFEIYPQTVLIPWHIQASKRRPIEPKPHQFPTMCWLAVAQLPCVLGMVCCATLMARGVGHAGSQEAPPASAPTTRSQADLDDGRAVYAQYCQTCHQADGRGRNGTVAADFSMAGSPLSKPDDVLLMSIAQGTTGRIGTMPGWGSTLSNAQRRAVLAYIRNTWGASK
jgi:putative membrane protein